MGFSGEARAIALVSALGVTHWLLLWSQPKWLIDFLLRDCASGPDPGQRPSASQWCCTGRLSVVMSHNARPIRFSRTCLERTPLVVRQSASFRQVVSPVVSAVGEELQAAPDFLERGRVVLIECAGAGLRVRSSDDVVPVPVSSGGCGCGCGCGKAYGWGLQAGRIRCRSSRRCRVRTRVPPCQFLCR
jgi:hypothetical protein